jgi:hypothetical protein
MHNLNRGKSSPQIWATSRIFKKTAQCKQSPKKRKFAQSGHPVSNGIYKKRGRKILAKELKE